MTSPTTYEAIQHRQDALIRKALEGSIFLAPYSSPVVTAMTTGATSDLVALPTGYEDVGWVDKKTGATWSRRPSTTDVESWGSVTPTRRDITKDERGLKFVAQETKKLTLQLSEGVDLTNVTPDATTGEVKFNAPTRPALIFYRVFGLFVDGTGSDTIYVGRFLPKAEVVNIGDQVWNDDADIAQYDIEMNALVDGALGTSCSFFFGGPGWKKQLAAMSFGAS